MLRGTSNLIDRRRPQWSSPQSSPLLHSHRLLLAIFVFITNDTRSFPPWSCSYSFSLAAPPRTANILLDCAGRSFSTVNREQCHSFPSESAAPNLAIALECLPLAALADSALPGPLRPRWGRLSRVTLKACALSCSSLPVLSSSCKCSFIFLLSCGQSSREVLCKLCHQVEFTRYLC